MPMADPKFDVDMFHKKLSSRKLGHKLVHKDITGSTMDDARRLGHEVHEYCHGTVVVAERQTKARGARDNVWDASNTGNIYASFILHLPSVYKTFEGRFDLEVAGCLAVLRVVRKFGVVNAIPKWPNDVWVRGHKLAGFLAEDGRFDVPGTSNCLLVLGMGINVNADVRRNSELQSIATSIVCERGGAVVPREEFFAEVCLALEETLCKSREANHEVFCQENLFQKGRDICVTCPSKGVVIDGQFLEMCCNWDIKFKDNRTGDVLQGRSDFYTIRPKVMKKILVVFTGLQDKKSALMLSQWLITVVNSSEHVICLVPEASIYGSTEWMATCSLLILSEVVFDPDKMTSRMGLYLRRGGCVMGAGIAALFLAKTLEIPVKEGLLESSAIAPDMSLVHLHLTLTAQSSIMPKDPPFLAAEPAGISTSGNESNKNDSGLRSQSLVFPTNSVCFQFSQDFLRSDCPLIGGDYLSDSVEAGNMDQSSEKGAMSMYKSKVLASYKNLEEDNYSVAAFCLEVPTGGCIALWGFDLGLVYPPHVVKSKEEENTEVQTHVQAEEERSAVEADRFERDNFLQFVLKCLRL